MNITIRKANLDTDRKNIIAFLRENLTPESDETRYQWLYMSSPVGKALAYIALDAVTQNFIGMAAAFPRWIRINGKQITGWVLGDFLIHPEYRSGGPALALQRKLIEELGETNSRLFYDFPSASMMAIYRRIGIRESGRWVRYVLPVRTEPLVKQFLPSPIVYKPVAYVLDLIFGLWPAHTSNNLRFEIRKVDQPFSEEFSDLERRTDIKKRARIVKTADYLTWRFRDQPYREYFVTLAYANGVLEGFLIFSDDGASARIADVNARGENTIPELIQATARHLRRSTFIKTIQFPLLSGSHLSRAVSEVGFKARESSPFILSLANMPSEFSEPDNWILTGGDRDS